MLAGNIGKMENYAAKVLEHATNITDAAKTYEIKIQAAIARNNFPAALEIGGFALKKLGVHLPRNPGKARVLAQLLRTYLRLAGKSPEQLLALPEMKNPTARAAARILEKVATTAYFSTPQLFPIVMFQQIKLALTHGATNETPLAFILFGMLLGSILGRIESGYKYGTLGWNLMERLDMVHPRARVVLVFYTFIEHWKTPVRKLYSPMMEAHKIGLDTGDLEYAALSLSASSAYLFWSGGNLKELAKLSQVQLEICRELRQLTALQYLGVSLQTYRQLIKPEDKPAVLQGEAYNELIMIPIHLDLKDLRALYLVYNYKVLLAYLFQVDPELTLQYADEREKYLNSSRGMVHIPIFYMSDSLVRLAYFPRASRREQKRILKKLKSNQKKLKRWAHHSPMNHLHRLYLVEAEQARMLDQGERARQSYEKAINLARENEFINDEALAWELAGRFYLRHGPEHLARHYLKNARYAYSRWGADGKVLQLERKYPEIFKVEAQALSNSLMSTGPAPKSTSNSSSALDLVAIMKAAQTISGETELDQLLRNLMDVVLESAGARRGIVVLKQGDAWLIEALSEPGQEFMEVLQNLPLAQGRLPQGLVNFVIHTRETVVLDNACGTGHFVDDPYIQSLSIRSVLCLPLIHKGDLTGVLYLENKLTEGVFNHNRLEVMKILSAQIATSIQIALSREAERARIKAEAANRAKSEFLAGMSHELRTPLNGILGYTQLLAREKDLSKRQQQGVDTIHSSGKHLLTLIDDILDLSKIEAARLELFPAELRLPEFLESISALFRVQALQKDLSFQYEALTALPPAIQADEKRLRQILFNLLSNALRYTNEGQITFRVAHENESLRFQVEDTGVGIKAEDQQKIFEPFQQVGHVDAAREGTGLGLSICIKLVEKMGGTLSLDSVLGRGSTFTFDVSLPWTSVLKGEDAARKTARGFSGPPRRILIVDDNADNRSLLRNLLEPLGFEVAEAQDGQGALESARSNPPDLFFMDAAMPVMDGFTCTREIRKDPLLKDLPIIAISAGVFEKDRRKGLAAGANAYLSKPIDVEQLLNTLGHELGLVWEYEEADSPETPASGAKITGPARAEARLLLELAQQGDIRGVLDLAMDLELRSPELMPFTQEVQRLAKTLQERKLAEFVEGFVNQAQ